MLLACRCLEAISQSVHVSARPWTGLPAPQQQHGGRPALPPLSTAAMMASMPSVSLDALPPVGKVGGDGSAQPGSPRKRGRRQAGFATAQPNGEQPTPDTCCYSAVLMLDLKRLTALVRRMTS